MAKAVILQCGCDATEACGKVNLCAGLSACIEGAFHALNQRYHSPPELLDPPQGEPENPTQAPPPEDQEELLLTQEPPPATDVTVLVDARNGFNELNRQAMLWTVRHQVAKGGKVCL